MQIKRDPSGTGIIPRSGIPGSDGGSYPTFPGKTSGRGRLMANGQAPPAHGAAPPRGRALGGFLIGVAMFAAATTSGQDIERDPINYSSATPRNVVAQLQERLTAGTATLEFEPEHGYLRSLLRAL